MGMVASQYAFRSVRRNIRRTLLAVVGIGVGCALALFMESLNRGRDELFARAGAEGGTGHLRIVPDGWRARRDPRLRLADGRAYLDAARTLPGVLVATPRPVRVPRSCWRWALTSCRWKWSASRQRPSRGRFASCASSRPAAT